MTIANYGERIKGRYYRTAARVLFRRPLRIMSGTPFVSFTFDDFPRSALLEGGAILRSAGLRGSYYASLGLMGREAPCGAIFEAKDLETLLADGHELGCHTFGHCHSWETSTAVFEDSIIENRKALRGLLRERSFRTFAYPIEAPRARTKQKISKYFACCRGGGQTANAGIADLNYLSAYFLEKTRGNLDPVRNAIELNRQARGWLIFATHDVCRNPSPFGCSPEFFAGVVESAVASGARILPVCDALDELRGSS